MSNNSSLNEMSFEILKKLGLLGFTLGTAESCTGGLISKYLTMHPGSSKVFQIGLVTYSNNSKIKFLNIEKQFLDNFGAVSKEVVLLMVKNLLTNANVDVGIAVSGIAGPSGGSKNKPVGLVHHAIAIKNKTFHYQKKYLGNRSEIRLLATKKCFQLLLNNI